MKYTSEKAIQQCLVSITTHFSYGHRPTFEMVNSEINDKKYVETKIENVQSKKEMNIFQKPEYIELDFIDQRF